MANAAILALSAIRTPNLIVDPAGCDPGLWLAACMMILSRKLTHVGSASRLAHYSPSRTRVDNWTGLSLRANG